MTYKQYKRWQRQQEYVDRRNAVSAAVGFSRGLMPDEIDTLETVAAFRHDYHCHPDRFTLEQVAEIFDRCRSIPFGILYQFYIPDGNDLRAAAESVSRQIEALLATVDDFFWTRYCPTGIARERRKACASANPAVK